jgi:teichuronic acid biosynthesis glycosyltransferase TuaG
MEDFGKVSIIMPSYNSERTIALSIRSILQQTYQNFELLIDDGCSTDKTLEIIRSFSDPRILLSVDEKRQGIAYSRNVCFRKASGKYVAFLDADDLWAPMKLEKQLRFMEENHYVFSYTTYYEIDESNEPTGIFVTGPQVITKRTMHHYAYAGILTLMYNREKVGLIQMDEAIRNSAEDEPISWAAVEAGPCYLLDEPLAYYRVLQGSSSHISKRHNLESQYKLYRNGAHHSWLVSWYLAFRKAFYYVFVKKPRYRRKVDPKTIKVEGICNG